MPSGDIAGHLAAFQYKLGQSHTYFRFSCGDESGTGLTQRSRIAKVSATYEYLKLRVQEACLLNDFGSVFDVRAQDHASRLHNARVIEGARAQYISIYSRVTFFTQSSYCVEIEIDYRDRSTGIPKELVDDFADRAISNQNTEFGIYDHVPIIGNRIRLAFSRRRPTARPSIDVRVQSNGND